MTSGSYIVTEAQAIFSDGQPIFSQPKTTSPVGSTLKNCDLGFWKTEPTERAVS